MKKITASMFFVLFLAGIAGGQTSTAIFVDGGYSPGKGDSDMDKMLDKRISDAMKIAKKNGADTSKVEHRPDLEAALKNLHCKCGDEITLYMVGHGSESIFGTHAFEFVKDSNPLTATPSVTPSDLRDWLKKAADECCCKIHVVIFSCHSGAFRDELLRDSHVVSVYTSCSDKELSYSDASKEDTTFKDGGDWLSGFNEDWEKSKDTTTAGRLQDASESADDLMPNKFAPLEHPTGWRKGEIPVVAHVVARTRDGKPLKIVKLKLHFIKPEFLRCTTREINVKDANVPDSVDYCKWVSLTVHTGQPGEKITVDSGATITVVDPPTERVLAHVEGGDVKKLKIHIISPNWLYCNYVKLEAEPPGGIDKTLKTCNWVQINIKIKDPEKLDGGFSTSDSVKPKDQTFPVKVHITKIDKEKGIVEYHILDPPWLKCQNKETVIPPGERGKLAGLDKCSNMIFDLTFRKDGTDSVSNIKIITTSGGIKKFSLDASIQRPVIPLINDSTFTYQPLAGVTNTGLNTVSFPVYAVICKLSDFSHIENWWRTGEGLPSGVWFDVKNVTNLPFAETRIVNFNTWNVPQGSETYWMGFRTKLNGDENPSSDTASIVFTVTQYLNHPPMLSSGYVEPDSGSISTTFTFRVTYTDVDNDPPQLRQIFIDNIPHDMIATGNNYTEGVVYGFQTTVDQGSHTFYFKFDDGHGHLVTTQTFTGPNVIGSTNQPPTLQQGGVMPDSGFVNTPFTFRVLYTDPDNDPPSVHQVFVDNNPFNMIPTGSNFNEGVFFIFQMNNLYPGNHNFYFRFDDGHNHMVTSQTYQGPIVR